MHKVFISYHHGNDLAYKNALLDLSARHNIFIDRSVDTGDISEDLPDQAVRQKIRDEYLRDTTVTILLVGTETKNRKHVDWELYSSMIDGVANKRSGILVVTLPDACRGHFTAAHGDEEKELLHPECTSWTSVTSRAEYEKRYPYLPNRITDNLLSDQSHISVVPWSKIGSNPEGLRFLIAETNKNRLNSKYDLSRDMMRRNIRNLL